MLSFDYRNHACPYPVVETRKQMLAHPDNELVVLVDDEICRDNVARLANKMGYQITATECASGFELRLTPLSTAKTGTLPQPAAAPQPENPETTVIYCGSDCMGTGDPQLGRVLLKNFLITQLELDPLPAAILFVNSGIHLTTAGSEVIEILSSLQTAGVDIASCGLCLDFYNKKEQLRVGRVTNMLDIVEIQNQARRILCP